jgi:hypothetical protein
VDAEGEGEKVGSGVGEVVSAGESDSCANNVAVAPKRIRKMGLTFFVIPSGVEESLTISGL